MRIDPAVFEMLEESAPPSDGWHICEIFDVDETECRHRPELGLGVRFHLEVIAGRDEGAAFRWVFNTRAKDQFVAEGSCRRLVRLIESALGRGKFPRTYEDLVGKVVAVKVELMTKERTDGHKMQVLRVVDTALAGDVGVSVDG